MNLMGVLEDLATCRFDCQMAIFLTFQSGKFPKYLGFITRDWFAFQAIGWRQECDL
jgi:hypothetical protein